MGGVHGIDEGMVPDAIRPASRRPKGAASSQPGATPRVKPARGNDPGSRAQATKALKGRATHGMLAKTTVWFALSGLGSIGGGQPGALPRAGMGRAVGASSHARRRMSESMASLGDLPNTLPVSTENVEEPNFASLLSGTLLVGRLFISEGGQWGHIRTCDKMSTPTRSAPKTNGLKSTADGRPTSHAREAVGGVLE